MLAFAAAGHQAEVGEVIARIDVGVSAEVLHVLLHEADGVVGM